MTTRETSRAAYEQLVQSGQLVGKQRLVLDALIVCGPATSGEVLYAIGSAENGPNVRNVNAWRARFTELADRGLIREIGERKCKITGRRGIVWGPTDRAKPLSAKRRPRAAERWQAMAHRLAGELAALQPASESKRGALAAYRRLTGAGR